MRLLRITATLVLLYLLAVAGASGALANDKVFICHATNDPGHFNLLEVDENALNGHRVGEDFHVNKKTGEQDYFATDEEIAQGYCGEPIIEPTATPTPTIEPTPYPEGSVGPNPTIVVNETPAPSVRPDVPNTAMGLDDNDEDRGLTITFGGLLVFAGMWWLAFRLNRGDER